MSKTQTKQIAQESTQEIVNKFLIQCQDKAKEEDILSNLENISNLNPLKIEQDYLEESKRVLVDNYFDSRIKSKYQGLSKAILELKTKVKIDLLNYLDKETIEKLKGTPREVETELPVFFSRTVLNMDSTKEEDRLFEFTGNKAEINYGIKDGYGGTKEMHVSFSSPIPPLTKDAREKAKEATAYLYQMYSDALKTKTIGDILLSHIGKFSNPAEEFKLGVIWKPKISELEVKVNVIDKDPALVLNWKDKLYLITTWNVQGEEPFEHYIKEYSVKQK